LQTSCSVGLVGPEILEEKIVLTSPDRRSIRIIVVRPHDDPGVARSIPDLQETQGALADVEAPMLAVVLAAALDVLVRFRKSDVAEIRAVDGEVRRQEPVPRVHPRAVAEHGLVVGASGRELGQDVVAVAGAVADQAGGGWAKTLRDGGGGARPASGVSARDAEVGAGRKERGLAGARVAEQVLDLLTVLVEADEAEAGGVDGDHVDGGGVVVLGEALVER
jgi:hypothetical protein